MSPLALAEGEAGVPSHGTYNRGKRGSCFHLLGSRSFPKHINPDSSEEEYFAVASDPARLGRSIVSLNVA